MLAGLAPFAASCLLGCGQAKKQPRSTATQPAVAAAINDTQPSDITTVNPSLKLTEPVQQPPTILTWETVDGLTKPIAIFDHVFWEPDDTSSFRQMLQQTRLVKNKTVLEIGTGSGLIALCCLEVGAKFVVATDINPWAQKNAVFNARQQGTADRLQTRLVSQKTPHAWSVVGPQERFDIIFSNPPWQPGKPIRVEDFAFYDPDFQLMKSFMDGLPDHLNPGGRAFLAYGCVEAISKLKALAAERKYQLKIHDKRDPQKLKNLFLPGMLVEVIVPVAK